MTLKLKVVLASTCLACLASVAQARPYCSDPPPIDLLPLTGTRGSAVFETLMDISPGDLACFRLRVPAAGTLHVTVASVHDNAFFRLYPPGWTIKRNGRAFSFGEDGLPGAAEADYARSWQGPMPQTGTTLIVVGMKEGGGQYRLHVELR